MKKFCINDVIIIVLVVLASLFSRAMSSSEDDGYHISENMTPKDSVSRPGQSHSLAESVYGGPSDLASLDLLVTRKLNQTEKRLERRLLDRMQLLNQTVSFTHMEKLLHHLNEELLLNRDQLSEQSDQIILLKTTLSSQNSEIESLKSQMALAREAIDRLTRLVTQVVVDLAANKGITVQDEKQEIKDRELKKPTTSSPSIEEGDKTDVDLPNQSKFPIDCQDVYSRGGIEGRGFHYPTVQPRLTAQPFRACCYMSNNSSWTMIQRRVDGSVDFFRGWADYKRGFGDLEGEFWLGNDHIHELTNQGDYRLRIEMITWEDHSHWVEYKHFRIAGEGDKYRLHVAGYTGNAGNSLSSPWENDHNGQAFSTRDADHDNRHYDNCAEHYKGAWWFKSCFQSHLNGVYYPRGSHSNFFVRNGIQWNTIHPHSSLKDVKMMIRMNEDRELEEEFN